MRCSSPCPLSVPPHLPPLFVILTLFLFHSQVTSVPVRDSWPALKPGVTNNVLFSFSDHQRASSVFWLCRNLQGDDQWRSGKQRRCCGAGYATWKPGLSGQARERGKKWGGGDWDWRWRVEWLKFIPRCKQKEEWKRERMQERRERVRALGKKDLGWKEDCKPQQIPEQSSPP